MQGSLASWVADALTAEREFLRRELAQRHEALVRSLDEALAFQAVTPVAFPGAANCWTTFERPRNSGIMDPKAPLAAKSISAPSLMHPANSRRSRAKCGPSSSNVQPASIGCAQEANRGLGQESDRGDSGSSLDMSMTEQTPKVQRRSMSVFPVAERWLRSTVSPCEKASFRLDVSERQRFQVPGGRNAGAWLELERLVASGRFECIFAAIIVVNVLFMALEAQYYGLQLGYHLQYHNYDQGAADLWPGAKGVFRFMDYFCGVAFTVEIVLKAMVFRSAFVRSAWTWLDVLIMICWYVEKLSRARGARFALMRVAKALRLVKLAGAIGGVVEIEGCRALYLIITTLKGSLYSMGWTCFFLFSLQMLGALVMQQLMLLVYFNQEIGTVEEQQEIFKYFGSFARSLLTMFELSLANWTPPCRLLVESVSEWFMIVIVLHKLTIGFAVVSVLRGLFLQETFKVASSDDTLMLMQKEQAAKRSCKKISSIFHTCPLSFDSALSINEFRQIGGNEEVRKWLSSMELDVKDAEALYKLLDADGNGALTLPELVHGADSVKGPARNIDLLVMMQDIQDLKSLVASKSQVDAPLPPSAAPLPLP